MTGVTMFLYYFLYKEFIFEVSFQIVFLSILVAIFSWYMLRQPSFKGRHLTTLEEDELIKQFCPEELIPENAFESEGSKKRLVTSKAGKNIFVDGRSCLNLATQNFLCLIEDPEVQINACASINKYGVGSCGPRGFYGTVDVHLELEEKLAEFMEVEEACVYSYGFATMASAIPAYCKRSDVVFVDEAVNFSIQKGLDASRSNICFFKHNDMIDLERHLKEQMKIESKNFKKASKTRKFLIVEGIYANTGKICNLPELIKLRKEFKLRLLLDESLSFGTLGATGKGVVEFFNIPNTEVDLRVGSMEGSLASVGGFCCGASFIVEHQRLSGLGYCFSASLPPFLAVTALTSLNHIKSKPNLFETLKKACCNLHSSLSELLNFNLVGDPYSPIKYLYLKKRRDNDSEKKILHDIVDYCLEKNVAVVVPEYLINVEKFVVRPSLRITANVLLTLEDIKFASQIISDASEQFIPMQ